MPPPPQKKTIGFGTRTLRISAGRFGRGPCYRITKLLKCREAYGRRKMVFKFPKLCYLIYKYVNGRTC